MTDSRNNKVLEAAAFVGAYSLIAFAYLVYPIIDRFGKVLLGTALFQPDAVLTAAIIEWGYKSLWSPALHVWDWVAGFPMQNSLAITENLLGWQIFYTPLRLAGVGVIGAFNTILVASLVIAALGAALFARRFNVTTLGAGVAGFIFGFGPFHLNHIFDIQTMGLCWVGFALYFLDLFLEKRSLPAAVGLLVSYTLTAYFSVYFGVFLLLVIPGYAVLCWTTGRYRFDVRTLGGLVATGVAAICTVVPMGIAYARFGAEQGYFPHSLDNIVKWSMEVAAIGHTPSFQIVYAGTVLARPLTDGNWLTPAFPGIVALALSMFAIVHERRSGTTGRIALVLTLFTLVSFALALGPLLKIPGYPGGVPWLPMPGRIWQLLPGIRFPMRFYFFALLGGAVLAGVGFSRLSLFGRKKSARIISALALIALMIEYHPARWIATSSVAFPDPLELSDSYPVLKKESDRGGVVELPVRDSTGDRTRLVTRYIYGSSGHLRRIVAVAGSFDPPIFETLRAASEALPDERATQTLARHGVSRVVVHKQLMPADKSEALISALRDRGYRELFSGAESVLLEVPRQR